MALQINAVITSLVDNSTLATLPFTWNDELNCYVCDVDIDEIDMPDSSQAKVAITMVSDTLSKTAVYNKESIYVFNTDSEYITDRTQADVDYVKTLNEEWYVDELTDAEKAAWNTPLKGALNAQDITRIQTQTNKTLDWYIKKYNSFINTESYYISTLDFYDDVIPDGVFMYQAGFTEMLTQLNKLFTWLNEQPYTDMPPYLLQLITDLGYYLNYTFSGTIPNSMITFKNYMAWNDLEVLLYLLFLTVISYNRNIVMRKATDFRWHSEVNLLVDYEYAGESLFAGSRFI